MKKIFLFLSFLTIINCKPTVVEHVLSRSATVIDIDQAKFVVDENTVADSQKIRIEKRPAPKIVNNEGYRIVGPAYVINPATLTFEKPVQFACPANKKNLKLAVKIANGFVPLAESRVAGETLQAKILHGGEYFLVEVPEKYGIIGDSKTDQGLLIVSDLYVGKYLEDFKKVLKKEGYNYPVWTYVYSGEHSIEENAKLLADELKRLHSEYGKFRMDLVGFGVGGLITHRYVADSALYRYDISSAIIAVGTPFFGSNFADYDSIKKSQSLFRFFFADAMGENARELSPSSGFVKWITENRSIVGWVHDDLEENKNFASLSAKKFLGGSLPEDNEGDFLVAWKSTQLTWIEPEPFPLYHFELFDNREAQEVAVKFVILYRKFNWPKLFTEVWNGRESFTAINNIWEEEINLTFRKQIDFDVLLEWNTNLLMSAPPDAILITNGDMDTFTGWFLQQRGIRTDVIIANRSLLNTTGYIRFLQKNGLPLDLDSLQVANLKPYQDKTSGKTVFISDQVIKLLAEQRKRPLVFATTVYNPENFGYPLVMNGLVYRIGEDGIKSSFPWLTVDINACQDLVYNKFRYEKSFSIPFDSLNQTVQNIWRNYGGMMYSLALTLRNEKKYDEALKAMSFVIEHFRWSKPTIAMFYYLEAEIYLTIGNKEEADKIVKIFMDLPYPIANREDSLMLVNFYKGTAKLYEKMGEKDQAIKLLAEGLKITPDDKELLKLIQKDQED
jgi:tetratricopeptide (TPR) repeat protein